MGIDPIVLLLDMNDSNPPIAGHKKRKRIVCDLNDCQKPLAMIIGHCTYCTKHFCLLHRLPETHGCEHMGLCKKKSFSRNEKTLLAGRCVPKKVGA